MTTTRRNNTRRAIIFASALACATSAFAQSESAGVNQYFTNCASCHESDDPGHQAPKTAVLKKMTPERILEAMTTGSMRTVAANISDADKRLIAEWVAEIGRASCRERV